MSQADEAYHVGDDDRQHEGDADDCAICLKAENATLRGDNERLREMLLGVATNLDDKPTYSAMFQIAEDIRAALTKQEGE